METVSAVIPALLNKSTGAIASISSNPFTKNTNTFLSAISFPPISIKLPCRKNRKFDMKNSIYELFWNFTIQNMK